MSDPHFTVEGGEKEGEADDAYTGLLMVQEAATVEVGKFLLSGLGRRRKQRLGLLERLNELDAFLQQLIWRIADSRVLGKDIGESADKYVDLVGRVRTAASADSDERLRALAVELRKVSVPFVRIMRVGF